MYKPYMGLPRDYIMNKGIIVSIHPHLQTNHLFFLFRNDGFALLLVDQIPHNPNDDGTLQTGPPLRH